MRFTVEGNVNGGGDSGDGGGREFRFDRNCGNGRSDRSRSVSRMAFEESPDDLEQNPDRAQGGEDYHEAGELKLQQLG